MLHFVSQGSLGSEKEASSISGLSQRCCKRFLRRSRTPTFWGSLSDPCCDTAELCQCPCNHESLKQQRHLSSWFWLGASMRFLLGDTKDEKWTTNMKKHLSPEYQAPRCVSLQTKPRRIEKGQLSQTQLCQHQTSIHQPVLGWKGLDELLKNSNSENNLSSLV